MSLDKRANRQRTENEKLTEAARRFLSDGELNPPFPYTVEPFDPQFFNLQAEPPKLGTG